MDSLIGKVLFPPILKFFIIGSKDLENENSRRWESQTDLIFHKRQGFTLKQFSKKSQESDKSPFYEFK